MMLRERRAALMLTARPRAIVMLLRAQKGGAFCCFCRCFRCAYANVRLRRDAILMSVVHIV